MSITSFKDGDLLNTVYAIDGSATDNIGVTKVMVKIIFDETFYFDPSKGWTKKATWVTAEGTDSWTINTSLVPFAPGKRYTVTVSGSDAAGNIALSTPIAFTFFSGAQAYSTLTLDLSSSAILQTDSLSVTGKLSRLPQAVDLSGLPVTIRITAPDHSVKNNSAETYDKNGFYKLEKISGFDQKGAYAIEAIYDGSLALSKSSESKLLQVGSKSGYAIIVEGKIFPNEDGLESHNKTANRVYQQFIKRGFLADDIRYFNYAPQPGVVYASPTKAGIQDSIQNWAKQKMNDVTAPLYLVMVDHGSVSKFHLGAELVSPTELDSWIGTLELGLDADAAKEKRIVVLGACYSGSFLPGISKTNRILVSSASANEESFKGPLEPDNIRVGEFFLEELFREWGRGNNLKDAFKIASANTAIFTRKGGGVPNSTGAYLSDALQHPLLDDNGDTVGSRDLLDGPGDGQQAKDVYLGSGLTNSAAKPADLVTVTETQYLGSSTDTANLWAVAADNTQVSSAWVEVRSPTKILSSSGGTNQQEVDLTRNPLILLNGKWTTQLPGFNTTGRYEIFYFASDKETGNVSPMKRSIVYKKKPGNTSPSAFSMLTPLNQATTKTVAVFEWEPSTDPDGVTYNLIIASDTNLSDVVIRQEEIQANQAFVDKSAGLADATTYYWKVQAVDAYGAVTDSVGTDGNTEIRSFTTNDTNSVPGIIKGIVRSDQDFSAIAGALVKLGNAQVQTKADGSFILLAGAGTVALTGNQTGFQGTTLPSLEVKSGGTTHVEVTLHSLMVSTTTTSVPAVTTSVATTTTTSVPAVTTSVPTTTTTSTPAVTTSVATTSTTSVPSDVTSESTKALCVPGDVAPLGNPNGDVDIGDAVVVARMVAGLIPSDMKADVAPIGNPSGDVDIGDAVVVARAVAGLVTISVASGCTTGQ